MTHPAVALNLAWRQVCTGDRRRSLLGSDRHHLGCGESRGAPYRHDICKKALRKWTVGWGGGGEGKNRLVYPFGSHVHRPKNDDSDFFKRLEIFTNKQYGCHHAVRVSYSSLH